MHFYIGYCEEYFALPEFQFGPFKDYHSALEACNKANIPTPIGDFRHWYIADEDNWLTVPVKPISELPR